MADEFLHGIDINVLKSELKMDVPEIAKLVGISENGVYKWSWTKEKQGTRPSFNALIKLLKKGASVEALFGVSTNKITPPQNTAGNISMAELARFFYEVAKSLEKPIQT